MKIKSDLSKLASFYGHEPPSESAEKPLDRIKDRLVAEFEEKEDRRLFEAERRSEYIASGGALLDIAKRIAKGLSGASEDRNIPCVLSFDAYEIVKDASNAAPKDRGLKSAALMLYRKWAEDVDGSLSLSDLDRVKGQVTLDHPKSAAAQVIDRAVSRVGFNTLKNLPKLARIASEITDQSTYEAAIGANGLDGQSVDAVRARGFIRALVGMVEEDEHPSTTDRYDYAGQREAALDRTLMRIGVGAVRHLGQIHGENPTDKMMGHSPPAGPDMDAGMPPHEEEAETSSTIQHPQTGDSLVVELSKEEAPLEDMGPSMPKTETGSPMLGSEKIDKMEFLGRVVELARIAQAATDMPMPDGQMGPDRQMGPGEPAEESKTIIEDPVNPGQELELTIRTVEEEPEPMGMPKGPGEESPMQEMAAYAAKDGDMEMCAEHDGPMSECAHMHKEAKTPPGREKQVKELKKEKGIDNPWAVSWASYNKSHKKKKKKSFAIYAVMDGQSASEPIDQADGFNIFAIFDRLAGFGVDGDVLMNPKDPDNAVVVLNAERGDHLQIFAVKPGSDPYEVSVNQQQPDQVEMPADGGEALKSDGEHAQLRATRKISQDLIKRATAALGIDKRDVEIKVLAGETVSLADWQIKMAGLDSIEYGRVGKQQRRQSLLDLDEAVLNFEAGVVESTLEKIAAFDESISYDEIFAYRCASCKAVSEYLMPKVASDLNCGQCGAIQKMADVAAAFRRLGEAHKPDFLISVPWPKGRDSRDAAINAKRVLAEVKKVLTAELVEPEEGNLRLVIRKADKPALARVQKILRGVFGMPTISIEAQVGDLPAMTPEPSVKPISDVPNMNPPAPAGQASPGQASPFSGQSPMSTAPAGQPMQPMQAPQQTAQVGQTAQQNFVAQHTDPLDPNKAKFKVGKGPGLTRKDMGSVRKEDVDRAQREKAEAEKAKQRRKEMNRGRIGQFAPGPEMGPEMGAPVGPGGMGPDMADPMAPQMMGMQPSEALGQLPNQPQMDMPEGGLGQGMDETGKEAAYAALMHYRNQGMGVLDALAEFRRQYGDFIESMGDESSPERHMAEAEIVRVAGEVYEKPALIQRSEEMVKNALRIFGHIFTTANSRNDAPGKGLEPKKINTQQPDWVSKKKVELDPDHEKDDMPSPSNVPTQHPPHGVKLTPNPSNLGPDGDSREPNFHNPMPEAGGQGGSRHPQKGESWSNTKLGPDSETKMSGEISRAMDRANAGAPGAMRSKK